MKNIMIRLTTATCLLLSATFVHSVLINWGAGKNPLLDQVGFPLEKGSHVQLIWDRDQDGMDFPDEEGFPTGGDELLAISFIGNGSFIQGTFSENTHTGTVTIGDLIYVRAWNGRNPGQATRYGNSLRLWTIDSDLNFTLDVTRESRWGTHSEWAKIPDSGLLTQTYAYALYQNYPNPFGRKTMIVFTIPGKLIYSLGEKGTRKTVASEKREMSLRIYDSSGRLVVLLEDGKKDSGVYRVEWNGLDHAGREVSNGIYFYSLSVGEERDIRKMILVR